MPVTMTWVGLDVHARSTHAAAIDAMTGELLRARFGPGIEGPVAWLCELPGPVRACYEAGPTGFGLYRAARAAGIGVQVIAPGKTPRGPSDRVKTDRKDAELLARLLLAGSLTRVVVPAPEVEAAREMTRTHDACRRDLMNARHRVSKMLLRHGRVYPKSTTWTVEHRKWLSAQQFEEPASDLVFADLIAAVDGLTSRKSAIALRLSEMATDERWWPTVARLRAFRGIDTLTAFSLHLEARRGLEAFPDSASALGVARVDTIAEPVRGVLAPGRDHQDRFDARPATAGRVRLALQPPTQVGSNARQPSNRPARSHPRYRKPCSATPLSREPLDAFARQPHNLTVVACARQLACFLWGPASSGPPLPPTKPRPTTPQVGGPGRRAISGRHARFSYEHRPRAARSLLDSASRQHETGP